MTADPLLLVILSASIAAGLGVLAVATTVGGKDRKAFANRLSRVKGVTIPTDKNGTETLSLRNTSGDSQIKFLNRLIARFLPQPAVLRERLIRTGLQISLGEYVLFSAVVGILVGHANRPREALTRLENMIGMAGINLPSKAVRTQISDAVDMIIQISRMRDGMRRITSITEVTGMEGDVIVTQELFNYQFEGENASGVLMGSFKSSGLRPHFTPKAEYYSLDKALLEVI